MTLPQVAQSAKELSLPQNLGHVIQANHIDLLIDELKKRLPKKSLQKVSILVETSSIKNFLQKKIDNFAAIDFTEPAQFDPLLRYMIDKELAEVFHLYAKFGQQSLQEWLDKGSLEATLYQKHVKRSVPLRAKQIHLFHPTYLPKWYIDPLLKRNTSIELYIYILSPSPLFLFDLVQEKHLHRDLFNGAYLEDQYRLLAHLIPYKRPLLELVESKALELIDRFSPFEGNTSLIMLKRNLYFQQNERIYQDASLAVIPAKTRFEEVENCFAFIYHLLQSDPSIRPSDVTIYADLKLYAPILEIVFEDKVALKIDQVPYMKFDPSVKRFFFLFELIEESWTLLKLKSIFEIEELVEWLEHVGFVCGYNPTHQIQTLGVDQPIGGSFQEVFEELLKRGTQYLPDDTAAFPLSLMQPLLDFKERLQDCYRFTIKLKKMETTLEEWLVELKTFFVQFLNVSQSHPFFEEWNSYRPLMDETVRDFYFIRQLFYDLFDSLKGPLLLNEGDRVVASNMKEGAILPNKIFYVMGMGLEDFPGYKELSSLYELNHYPPPQGVIDRYRFLELILCANERLIFSYASTSPSTVIEEIFKA